MFHPSGGLIYHLRARRGQAQLWRPFHAQVEGWLAAWQPPTSHLVLVGPSAGYALNRAFLQRFTRITVLEPDPIARWLLHRRFPGIHFDFRDGLRLAGEDGFDWLAQTTPDAAILFCNLLGQTLVGRPTGLDHRAWLARLEPALKEREWASWHDLASTTRPPDHPAPFELPHALPLDQILARIWQRGELHIHDHACDGLCPRLARSHALWQLAPAQWFLVEWLHS